MDENGQQTWLVTGGAGFIGSALVRLILRTRPKVRVVTLDALTYAGVRANVDELASEPRHEFMQADVRDAKAVNDCLARTNLVFHLAAESHVDRSIADASAFVDTNVRGAQVVLDAARTEGVRVVLASTDEVYGHLSLDSDHRFVESDPLAPRSPYAASKASAELLAKAAHITHGQDVVVARGSNTLGPRQFPEKLVPLFVTNLILGRKVPLYGDGSNVRDWLHVDDHASALIAIAEHGVSGEAYNIGAQNEQTNLQLAHEILSAFGKDDVSIEHVADRPGHDLRYALDTAKLRAQTGWSPQKSAWPAMLRETIAWYRKNEGWWRPLRSK